MSGQPAEYHFHVRPHWNERVVVEQGTGSGIIVLDRETALQGIRDMLNQCVSRLVLEGHDSPNEHNLNVTVSDDLNFTIDAADVLEEPVHYNPEDDLLAV